jgi:hypothetical protein
MKKRELLTAAELTLAASALSAAVYGLVRASYNPYTPVEWVPIAIVGAGVALLIVGAAALLFVGRAALLLAAEAVQGRGAVVPPPSATASLWTRSDDERVFDAYASEHLGVRRHARHDAVHAAPMLPPTLPMPVEELQDFGYEPAGVSR